MARTGRPTTPIEVKRRRGTARPDRTPVSTALAAVPTIEPEPLELPAAEVLPIVLEAGATWLAVSDALPVVMLRETLEERAVVREMVMATQSPDARKALRDIDKQILELASQLGFNPSARARLGLAEVKAASTLEKLKANRAKG